SFVIFKFIFEAKPKNAGILPYFKAFRQAFGLNLFSKTDTALWSVSLMGGFCYLFLLFVLIGFILLGILHFSHILLYNDFKGSVANEKDNFFYTYNGYCAIFGGLQQISLRG
ncbi:MAG: hypothetical protein J6L58_03030, partial [Clostridia bacterium]|nr:hypothetical protein [Clostridia bacterium]